MGLYSILKRKDRGRDVLWGERPLPPTLLPTHRPGPTGQGCVMAVSDCLWLPCLHPNYCLSLATPWGGLTAKIEVNKDTAEAEFLVRTLRVRSISE